MGGKKSGGSATPYEAPNTLNSAQSLRIIDAVCEGEIRGFANGNDAPWKSVFLNDTPVQNADGSFNFKGLAGFFLRGTPDQPYIPGFDVSERTVAVSAEVKKSTPIVRAVTDKLVGRLRVTLGVDRNFQVQGNGDTLAAHTVLRVELVNKDGVRAVESVTFSERAGGVYYQDVLFDQLPEAPFNIRVSRLTDDAASDKTGNKTYFASFVEMIDAKLTYPHTVLAALSVDSDQFGNSVPRRNYLLDGMLVNVPSNYDPDTREYAGSVWDGSFKKAWTNNPAWVFYDVLTQPRYSTLARRLKAADIDKWTLYQVAKYCDELVDDGFGGKEPRFVCNAYLSDKRQAAELLTDLASVFRGLPVWDGRRFSVVMDADADAVAQYANSNVKDGLFTYSGAAFKSISTAVMVQYVDKYDGYRTKTEYVQDDEAVRRYGLNVRQVAAFGCDSRGQAARFGAWMLQTGLRQQDAVSFTVGREGLRHLPYDVIRIMDNDYAGADFSGRLKAVSGLTVTLDRPVEAEIGSRFSLESDGVLQTLEVMAKPAADRLELSAAPQAAAGDVWVLQGRVKARLYRVVSSKENTADGTFTVSALRHDPQKYGVVDGWAKFDREITTLHNVVPQLMNPSLTAGGGRLTMTWDNLTADGQVLTYDVKIYRNNVLYRHIPDAPTAEIVLENLPNGNYRAEIRGRNARGVLSEPLVKAWSLDYTIAGLKAAPRLQAIQLDWTLPQTVVNDVQTEIWYAESNNRDAAKKLTTLPYPQNSYTLSGVAVSDRYWFWLRLADAAGNSGEWTAAVEGRSDPNPAPIVAQLRGAIEKSSLSQALIDSLDADAASKVAAEAQARVAAIQAASKKSADDLASKARELGAKITVVENVNAEQARQIQAVTAAQGSTAAGLEAEKRARAEGDRAEAQARETLVGRVASAEGSINTLRETVVRNDGVRAEEVKTLKAEAAGQKAKIEQSATALASLDGKVRAMYGLKVETVSGGRKVIAGLALGADGQTGDAQMLVYADKFALVDPKSKILKSPFVVQTAGGKTQMALSGDFVADGLIHGRHIAAGQTLSSPSIEGGSLNIGGGQFTVASDGSLVAQNAVVRGRIEGESGYFNGTIKASRIEGDVMKVVRMKKLSSTVWEASIQAEALPMMVRPDFEVRTVNPDHARRNQATAEFLVDGQRQPVSRSFETRVTSVMKNEKHNTIDVKTDYTATTSYGWYVLPRNKSVLLRLQLAENETPTTPIPCLQTAYLSPSDAEYKTLIGKMVWRRLTDYVRLKVGWLEKGMWKAVYGLPDDIYGLRLKYLTDNNPEWANGIVWMQDGTATAIKANSTANHAAAPRQYTREVNQASSSNAVILSAHNNWQWMELRDVEVLVPEDRVF
ncbi:MAG: phage tail protein [Neisseria elongata]